MNRGSSQEQRLEEASAWFVRLRDEPVTDEIIDAWSNWCAEHLDNAQSFRALREIWSLSGEAGVTA